MADFKKALSFILKKEGGYINDPDDSGGETYKGIARNMWPQWGGWRYIDSKDFSNPMLEQLVSDFYRINFWDKVQGDNINNDEVAISIVDFAVNAGVKTSVVLAQAVVDAGSDGIIGPNTIAKINAFSSDEFISSFTVAKIARYITICRKNPINRKYFFGWVCRALNV